MNSAPFILALWNLFLGFTLLTVALPTVVAYRGLLQPAYQWGLFGVRGTGPSGSWWIIASVAAYGWLALSLAHRRPGKRPAAMLWLWHAGLFFNILAHALHHGSAMTLRGDAVGLSLNLAWLGPLCTGLLLLAASLCLRHFCRAAPVPIQPLAPGARRCVGAGLALGPVIAALFLLGDGVRHTHFDRAAIFGVVLQSLLIGAALQNRAPSRPRTAAAARSLPASARAALAGDKRTDG